jgi:hypothetical protein
MTTTNDDARIPFWLSSITIYALYPSFLRSPRKKKELGRSTSTAFTPVLINPEKCTSAQICTAFENYLAIFGRIARKRCANAGRWTPDTYRASSVQHLHSGMLAYINDCYLFRVAHSRKSSIVENFVSIVSFLTMFL